MVPQEGLVPAPAVPSMRRRPVSGSPLQPRRPARLLARARWLSLDDQLIAGADPARSPVLAARAARLTSERSRASIAGGLQRLAQSAGESAGRMRLRPWRAAVLADEAALRSLAERLQGAEPVYARGVARLERLLTDGNGPVFRGGAAALAVELATAEAELCGEAGPGSPSARGQGAGPARRRPGSSMRRARRAARRLGLRLAAPATGSRSARAASSRRADPPGFVGTSFMLPDGSWYHGRRDST